MEKQLKENGADMKKDDVISKNSKDIGKVKSRLEAQSQSIKELVKQVKEVNGDIEEHIISHKNIESSLSQVFQDIKSLQEDNKNSKELKNEIMLLKKDFADMRKQLENVEDYIATDRKDKEDELKWREQRALERVNEAKASKNRFIGTILAIVFSLFGGLTTVFIFYISFSYQREDSVKSELRNEITSVEERNEKSINRIEKSIDKIIELIPKGGK